jgi:hypothetical protein
MPMIPVPSLFARSRPRRWIAALLLLAGTLASARVAEGIDCLRTAPAAVWTAAASAVDTQERDTFIGSETGTPLTPAGTELATAPAGCGATALTQSPAGYSAAPPSRTNPHPLLTTGPAPAPDLAPRERPPSAS